MDPLEQGVRFQEELSKILNSLMEGREEKVKFIYFNQLLE